MTLSSEILPRLPVKSLLRLKCVSKSWNCLIFSPMFAKTHLRYSNVKPTRIMLSGYGGGPFCTKDYLRGHPVLTEQPMMVPTGYKDIYKVIDFVGSCNGLICFRAEHMFTTRDDIYLWNPATGKTKYLPGLSYESGYDSGFCSYAFGFSELCDDYKVIALFDFSCEEKSHVLVKIFSLKTGDYKRIKINYGCWIQMWGKPSFLNGKMHWLISTGEGRSFIAYLDLKTEKIGTIEKPDFVESSYQHSFIKEISGRFLYAMCLSGGSTSVWLVEPGYGTGKTTWTKVYSIPGDYENLLVMLDNGEIVTIYNQLTEILTPCDQLVSRFCAFGSCLNHLHSAIVYGESLVSPFIDWNFQPK